jgi:hypothetical protein
MLTQSVAPFAGDIGNSGCARFYSPGAGWRSISSPSELKCTFQGARSLTNRPTQTNAIKVCSPTVSSVSAAKIAFTAGTQIYCEKLSAMIVKTA